ncbi:MAG: glycosyltransferase family 39 protein [Candidatus Omnitrophota bacterium]
MTIDISSQHKKTGPAGFINKAGLSLFFITIAGSFLRLYRLSRQSFWLDEAYSVMMSKNIFTLWFNQWKDSSPPLYYGLLHFWSFLFGNGEFALRLLSALFGILLIPLIFAAGKTIFNKNVGIYAALLVAISPIHIYYSQEVKMYSLLSFLSLASFFLLFLSLENKRAVYWAGYVLTTVFCLYTHNYGVLLLFAEICFFALFFRRNRVMLRQFVLCQLIILSICLPRVFVLSRQLTMGMNPWIDACALKDLVSTFSHFCLLSWRLPLTGYVSVVLKIQMALFILIFLFGISARQRQRSFLLAYLTPIVFAFLISFGVPIYVAGRYDLLVFPAFCLVIAVGLDRIRFTPLHFFVLAAIIACTATVLHQYYFIYKKSNDRAVADYLQRYAGREDVIVATELSITPFEYYWMRDFTPRLFQFPDGPRAFLERRALEGEPDYIDEQVGKIINKVYPLLNDRNKLWVLYQPMSFSRKLITRLRNDLIYAGQIEFPPGDNLNQVTAVYIFETK